VLRAQGRVGLTVSEGWWWEGDERWQWHSALLESLGIRVDLEPRRLTMTENPVAVLTDHGFDRVSMATENYDLVFADVGEWWNWAWSHGTAKYWNGCPRPSWSAIVSPVSSTSKTAPCRVASRCSSQLVRTPARVRWQKLLRECCLRTA
jgi:hypothetical protein